MNLVHVNHVGKHIAVITLNRPEAANAMSLALLEELEEALRKTAEDPAIYCAILTGAGEKVFCAGADLKERKGMSEKEVVAAVRRIGDVAATAENFPVPLIAAINGAAFGGGLELSLACDIRIAAEDAKMGLTETSLAIIPGAGGTQRLPRLIGVGQAKRLIFSATPVNASEALKLGLIEQLADRETLLEEAIKLAKTIAANGPIALRQAKTAINQGMQTDIHTGLSIEHSSYKETIPTKDRQEGLAAFKEKRKPDYMGE